MILYRIALFERYRLWILIMKSVNKGTSLSTTDAMNLRRFLAFLAFLLSLCFLLSSQFGLISKAEIISMEWRTSGIFTAPVKGILKGISTIIFNRSSSKIQLIFKVTKTKKSSDMFISKAKYFILKRNETKRSVLIFIQIDKNTEFYT